MHKKIKRTINTHLRILNKEKEMKRIGTECIVRFGKCYKNTSPWQIVTNTPDIIPVTSMENDSQFAECKMKFDEFGEKVFRENGVVVFPIYCFYLKNGMVRLVTNTMREHRKLIGFGIASEKIFKVDYGMGLYNELLRLEDYNDGILFGVEVLSADGQETIAVDYDILGTRALMEFLNDYGVTDIDSRTLKNSVLEMED